MVKLSLLVGAFLASTAAAFAPTLQQSGRNSALHATAERAAPGFGDVTKTDTTGNNISVKEFLVTASEQGLLTKVAQSGLLSKAAKQGITLSKLEPLILFAAQKGILDEVLILTEAAGPEIIPLLPTVVNLAPAALPLLGIGLDILSPTLLQAVALASAAAAFGVVYIVPDDTIVEVALQTLTVVILGLTVPAASLGGAFLLGKLK